MICVIVANANVCKIYHYSKHPLSLTLLKEINHPENRLKNRELTSDKPGHYKGGESARGAYAPHMEAKEVEIDNFSRQIAKELNQGRNENEFGQFIIIAPPHMSGLLFKHINKHVKDLITNNIKKDLLHLSDRELLGFLQMNAQYQDQI
jgi:protein required for attachment to host cells